VVQVPPGDRSSQNQPEQTAGNDRVAIAGRARDTTRPCGGRATRAIAIR
jgi:hypothetical protein